MDAQGLQAMRQPLDVAVAAGVVGIQPPQLAAGDRGAERRHAGLEAETRRGEAAQRRGKLQDPRHVAQQHGTLESFIGIGQQDASLARRGELVTLQAEDADVPKHSARPVMPCRALRVRGVFNHRQPMLAGDGQQFGHAAGHPPQVDDHDRAGARRDAPAHVIGIQPAALGFALGKDRDRPQPEHGQHRRPPRGRRDDYLVARLELKGKKRRQQRGGAVAVRQGMTRAEAGGVIPLQFLHDRVGGDLPIPHDLQDSRLVFGRQERPAVGRRRIERNGGGAAQDGGPMINTQEAPPSSNR